MRIRICMLAAALAAVLPLSNVQAQVEASKAVRTDIRGVTIDGQNTPQFSVPNVKDKRFRPKTWLEMDVAFKADKAKTPENNPVIDSLEFKFYVLLNVRNKEGKLTLLTASATFVNIMEREEQHVLMYVSPSSLQRLLQKNTFAATDVSAWGVEIYKDGAAAGPRFISQGNVPFWDKTENFVVVDGELLPKVKTPFAPLWGDYDVEMKQQ